MHLPMATVVTTALVTALGGIPGALACAGSGFVHHTHTPCNPIHCPDAQALGATNGTQAIGGPPHPQGTHPSIPNLADGWQVCSKAGRGPHSPIPTALHTPRAVPSAAKAKGAVYDTTVQAHGPTPGMAESSAPPHTHDASTCYNDPFTTHIHTHATHACGLKRGCLGSQCIQYMGGTDANR